MKIAVRHPALIAGLIAGSSWFALRAADLPDGEGKELLQKRCGSCHGLYKVTDDTHTEEEWADVVDKMVSTGAVLNDDEFTTLVKYLAKNFGPPEKK